MTTGRFCAQCGKEADGSAFCQHCGAAQTVADAAATTLVPEPARNAFCPSCGTKAEPGLAFCTRCGANLATGMPLSPAQHVHPAGETSKTPVYVGVGAIVVALIIAVVVMSGGGDDSRSSGPSASSSSNAASSSAQPAVTAKPAVSQNVATLPKAIPVNIPATGPDAQLGPLDRKTTKATIDALTAAKVDLKGISVFVYPVYGTTESLLVFDIDSAAINSSGSSSQDATIKGLANIPALKAANVNRIAMNYKSKDKQGNYVMTVTLTMATLDEMSKGTLSQADMQKQMLGEVKRLP